MGNHKNQKFQDFGGFSGPGTSKITPKSYFSRFSNFFPIPTKLPKVTADIMQRFGICLENTVDNLPNYWYVCRSCYVLRKQMETALKNRLQTIIRAMFSLHLDAIDVTHLDYMAPIKYWQTKGTAYVHGRATTQIHSDSLGL